MQGADRRICGYWFTDGILKNPDYRKNGLRVMAGRLESLSRRLLEKRCGLFLLDDIMMFEMWMKGKSIKSLSTIHYPLSAVVEYNCTFSLALVLEYVLRVCRWVNCRRGRAVAVCCCRMLFLYAVSVRCCRLRFPGDRFVILFDLGMLNVIKK